MEDRRPRRFGAMRQHTARMTATSISRDRLTNNSRYSNTLEFDTVALEQSIPRHHHYSSNWDDNHNQFDFGQESPRQLEGPHAPSKYKSGKPKASGQTIGVPGSSFARTSSTSSSVCVTDGVLTNVFVPPKTQSAFLNSLTKRNAIVNQKSERTMKTMTLSPSTSSLEVTSAPEPLVKVSRLSAGSSGWKDRRVKQDEPKPRTLLTSTAKKVIRKDRNLSDLAESHYSLRDRSKSSLFENLLTSISSNPFRTKLGKRKLNSEGSAAKPIALDSDSESELQSDDARKSDNIIENDVNGNQVEKDAEVPAIDLNEILVHAIARIDGCDLMIGRFQCIVDMVVARDWLCLLNIRGKHEQWPLQEFYILSLDHLEDVRIYTVPTGIETYTGLKITETDRIDQLLNEAAYVAIKLPFFNVQDQKAMETFYDPTSSDTLKGYIVVCPLNYTMCEGWIRILEVFQSRVCVKIIEKEQAREHLQALMENSLSYKCLHPTNDTENHSPSESDENEADRNMTVLTYPLPPCTSDIVTIVRRDVARLNPRRYLNDNIIDYYFKRMMLTSYKDNEVIQKKVLFLSSHFYTRLRAGKGSTTHERMKAGYKNVSTWLARTDFFDRSIIFIPINKDLHWSLAVILNPGLARSDTSTEEALPCIAVLDPLGSYHRKAAIIRSLKTFLRMQWDNSQECVDNMNAISEYEMDQVHTLNVNAPHQENSYDCGVYVLKFAEVILKKCLDLKILTQNEGIVGRNVTDANLEALITSSAFSADDIAATRIQIRQFIEADASEYQIRRKAKINSNC
ncbi:putative Ulp1 protease family catalytic domain, papain-like cysteine peptidase superfamily [Plasmopara halstedii]